MSEPIRMICAGIVEPGNPEPIAWRARLDDYEEGDPEWWGATKQEAQAELLSLLGLTRVSMH